jgi:hypothetical protein
MQLQQVVIELVSGNGDPMRISYLWEETQRVRDGKSSAVSEYTTAVSLHSHTSLSEESLTFLNKMARDIPVLRKVFEGCERRTLARHGLKLDFLQGNWRPPLVPKMAFELETRQIQEQLGLNALVSITDHDTIQGPMLLRTVPSSRHIPVSVEWSAPYRETEFHLGVHNLPSETGQQWMQRFENYTAAPDPVELTSILRGLHALPNVLLVLNHPLWDLYSIGQEKHERCVGDFMVEHGACMHALELNGLRNLKENRAVVKLAQRWGQLLISGGDRHGLEPNAVVNLTNAVTFNEFVHEVRVKRQSHVLFMPQYAGPWEQRILRSTLDAVRNFPQFSEGWQRWDERAFHPDAEGNMRSMAELWPSGKPPRLLRIAIGLVHLLESRPFAKGMRMFYADVDMESGVGDTEVA